MSIKLGMQIMFYIIYKITNTINRKIYIGKHQTKDLNDGYMGSGKHLKHSIDKYGIDNFKKEVLFIFENENDMNAKEAEIVNGEFVLREDTYNICVGGQGGFSYINSNGLNAKAFRDSDIQRTLSKKGIEKKKSLNNNLEWRSRYSNNMSKSLLGRKSTFSAKVHTEETKEKISKSNSGNGNGSKNSQFGTMWITDGKSNKKIKKDVDSIPEGWYKGRS
jgi:hypothetical protein